MGQWGEWEEEWADHKKSCGDCTKLRYKEVIVDCAHGGDCDCEGDEEEVDCSEPCRKPV